MSEATASPLVSVIIPVHGRFDLARRAIDSVAAQTHRPIEILVVDDASPEPFALPARGVAALASARVLRLPENGGPGAAREAGRRAASGAFVAYLDSDDEWRPEHLASLVQALEADPGAGMAYSGAIELVENEPRRMRRWSDEAHTAILPALLWGRPWHTSACLWRRELTEAIGPWMPIHAWEDYEHDCRAGCLEAKLVHVVEPTCLVHSDAAGRVSEAPAQARRARGFALAVLSMAKHVRGTRFAQDPRVRERIRELLLAAAAKASDCGQGALAARAVCEAWGWRGPLARLAVASGAGIPLLWLAKGKTSARIFRWARQPSARPAAAPASTPAD